MTRFKKLRRKSRKDRNSRWRENSGSDSDTESEENAASESSSKSPFRRLETGIANRAKIGESQKDTDILILDLHKERVELE